MKVRTVASCLLAASLICAACAALVGWHAGYRLYAVRTGSMAPTYPTGSLLLDAPAGPGRPRVGQVVTFTTGDGLVTHRVHGVTSSGISTKGDANRAPDPWTLPARNIRGAVVAGVASGGYLLVFLQQPTGVASVMTLAVSITLAWSIFFGRSGSANEAVQHRPQKRAIHRALLPQSSGSAGRSVSRV